MNITLSADAALIEQAREIAARQGTSLNELVRAYLRSLVGQNGEDDPAAELVRLLESAAGHSGGQRFRREDAYEGR